MTWTVTEITVEAHYAGGWSPGTLTMGCQSVTEIPGGYSNPAQRDRSHFEYPRLIAEGIDSTALQKLSKLRPSRLLFRDQETGGEHQFPVQLLDACGNTAKFIVHS